MLRRTFPCVVIFLIAMLAGGGSIAQTSVVTQHVDLGRTGWYPREKILHTKNVKPGSFGKLFSRPVDDQIYAQPLVLMKVPVPGVGVRNVCYVATVNSTVYAFDADSANQTLPYWKVNLTPAGGRPANQSDIANVCGGYYQDFSGKFGIVGTPVIDSVAKTLYVVVKSYTGVNGFRQYLHALDVLTGAERPNSPVLITAQAAGNGSGSVSGTITFDALKQNQRSGLLLLNGVVYITWASHGDCDPYHGWILGYDQTSLAQTIKYLTTPEGYKGGIWMAGAGIAADENGNLYAAVGNGSVGYNGNPADLTNRSESALKLTPSGGTLTVSSFFTPKNFADLESNDSDFGVNGMMLIPGTQRVVSGAKDGNVYLMDRDNMGGYSPTTNNVIQTYYQGSTVAHNLTSLTYYSGQTKNYVFTWSDNVSLKALPFDKSTGLFDLINIKTNSVQGPVGYNGAFLSVSSRGSVDSTAILWTSYAASGNANQQTRPGILRAFSAADITQELWNTSMNSVDNPGNYAKFNCPTIANGKVYLATFSNQLVVYGLKSNVVTGLGSTPNERIQVYPNPAADYVTVKGSGAPMQVWLFDGQGQLLKTWTGAGELTLSTSSLAEGLYFIKVLDGTNVVTRKVMIRTKN